MLTVHDNTNGVDADGRGDCGDRDYSGHVNGNSIGDF